MKNGGKEVQWNLKAVWKVLKILRSPYETFTKYSGKGVLLDMKVVLMKAIILCLDAGYQFLGLNYYLIS